jgi:CMP/dCMP kinase
MIITIDGPAGTGKTTVAKKVAEELGFTYLDTGAMYRALTYGIISNNIDPDNAEALAAFLDTFPVSIKSQQGEKHIFLGSEDVTDKIRTREVTELVSKIAALATVREKLVVLQRKFAHGVNAVVEGRDMGTQVFPDADIKCFLTADPKIRAGRRYNELKEKFPDSQQLTLDIISEEIDRRDAFDAARDISPMKPADDAVIIDTSTMSIEDVIGKIIVLKERKESKSLNT